MKIDESSINHNAIRLIDELTEIVYECAKKDDEQLRALTLGNIRGVIEMAMAMKEVLKS